MLCVLHNHAILEGLLKSNISPRVYGLGPGGRDVGAKVSPSMKNNPGKLFAKQAKAM